MAPATAFDKPLAEALCNLEVPRGIKFSPNGQQILYYTRLAGGNRKGKSQLTTVWLASREAGSARPLTSGLFDDDVPAWHPNGKEVAFISDRVKPGECSAIWTLRLDGGDALPLTPPQNAQDVDAFAYSPDGASIAYISCDEQDEDSDDSDSEPDVWGERWEYARLRLVDVASKEIKILFDGSRHVVNLAWSPDGKRIAFETNENPHIEEAMLTGTTISVVEAATGTVKDLCTVPNELNDLTWAPDGKVYFLTGTPDNVDAGGAAAYAVDPNAASPVYAKVAGGVEDDASDLAVVGDKLLWNRGVRLDNVIGELGGKDMFKQETEVLHWSVHIDEDGTPTLAASLSNTNTPHDVYLVQQGKDNVKLSGHGKPVKSHSFGSCAILKSQSADGEVELDGLYLTPTAMLGNDDKPRAPLPTFVIIHGGPTDRNCDCFDSTAFYWAPYVLSRGYGVLLPQYRGSTGRGEKFASYSRGGQGKYDYADVISITDDAVKKGFADPKKLMVGGWSQGGLLTYLCSARNGLHGLGWRFNATIAGAGVCDIECLAMTADLGSTYEIELAGGHAPWTLHKDDLRNRQGSAIWEIAYAVEESKRRGQPGIPPMLILHGEDDLRCPFSQAEGYRRALRAYGLPCEFVAYPGEKHGPKKQKFWLDMLERVGRWCDLYIGQGLPTRG